jgi:hypothetical protein
MESKIGEANTHPPAGGFGWREYFLMGISFVNKLFFNCLMESKISEANSYKHFYHSEW